MTNIPKVSLKKFEYAKNTGTLTSGTISCNLSGFPREIDVVSHHTGEIIRFRQVSYEDPWCDHDFWDGEMMVYRPVTAVKNVGKLVLGHF